MKRAFVVVLDACGVGALPDAAEYGDAGTNTLGHLAELAGGLKLPNLERLGLGNTTTIEGVPATGAVQCVTSSGVAAGPERAESGPLPGRLINGRLHAIGPGKDSTAGHWALMGVSASTRLPTYPDGFPPAVLEIITRHSGRELLCNTTNNGIDALAEYGELHLQTGALILYTSQDSVLQLAAHEAVYATTDLHALCAAIRTELPPEHAVGRVIARPFRGLPGQFERTDRRRDFAIDPPGPSYLDALHELGVEVHSVGKAGDLFAGRGVAHQHPGATNAEALASTTALLRELDGGFVFTNLIETDQLYGHRHDVPGFAAALERIDATVGEWLPLLRAGDLLILTADHGVDPAARHTDHTREYVPLLAVACAATATAEAASGSVTASAETDTEPSPFAHYAEQHNLHEGPMADVGASVHRWLTGMAHGSLPGNPFV